MLLIYGGRIKVILSPEQSMLDLSNEKNMITYLRCSFFVVCRAFPPPMTLLPTFEALSRSELLVTAAPGCRGWKLSLTRTPLIRRFTALCSVFFIFFSALHMALFIRFSSSESPARGFSTYSDTTLHPDSVESASFISFCLPLIRFIPSTILVFAVLMFSVVIFSPVY